jgi:hypothetical protein
MRKWRAENREKNRQNDLRCRVYRLARQKFGDKDSVEKQTFIQDEIIRRLGRRTNAKSKSTASSSASSPSSYSNSAFSSTSPSPIDYRLINPRIRRRSAATKAVHSTTIDKDDEEEEDDEEDDDEDMDSRPWKTELPFYNMPHQKIELPSIDSLCPSLIASTTLRRRTSSSSESSISTTTDDSSPSSSSLILPPVHTFLYPSYEQQSYTNAPNVKYEANSNPKILDEFVGVVLEFAQEDHHHP